MVYIKRLKFSGLYSFSKETQIDFSDTSLLVGPNNSGKSNIFRIFKLLVDTFSDRKRLEDHDIYPTSYNPTLETILIFSREETERIIDFFSFHKDKQNNNSEYFQYDNRELLIQLLDTIHMKCMWKRSVEESSEPYVQIEFTKCGLKLFGRLFSDFNIFNEFPTKEDDISFHQTKYLTDILEQINNDDDPVKKVSLLFNEIQGKVGLPYLSINSNSDVSDEANNTLRQLFSFVGFSVGYNQNISFRDLLAVIFRKSIKFSSDRRGITGPTILDLASSLKMAPNISPNIEKDPDFNTILERQAFSKSLEFDDELQIDGSNLASFLFSLKNSEHYANRKKYESIQKAFEQIHSSENLYFDVIIKYEPKKRYRSSSNDNEKSKPKMPVITIFDRKLDLQFPINQVGSGLSETIYLLTLAYGIENSVILLDEPSSNLHPPLMRKLMRVIQKQNPTNQFIIITHSPELVSYHLFENDSEIFYIRRKNKISILKTPNAEIKEWFSKDRNRLRYLIDPRIFFSKAVILTEGESDKDLLSGMANYLELVEKEIDVMGNDVIIISTGGVKNFKRYISLLETFEIPYKGLVDADAKSLFPNSCIITKNSIQGTEPVCVIEGGDLEYFMNNADSESFSKAKQSNGKSKPNLAFAFTQHAIKKNPQSLKVIQDLLKESIKLARGETFTERNKKC